MKKLDYTASACKFSDMNWPWKNSATVLLSDDATKAETKVLAFKKAIKSLRKGVEESLKTGGKSRRASFCLDESVALALEETSLLRNVLEEYANYEKGIGQLLAENEKNILCHINSAQGWTQLLDQDLPAAMTAKKNLDAAKK